jgi:hypothetical protein
MKNILFWICFMICIAWCASQHKVVEEPIEPDWLVQEGGFSQDDIDRVIEDIERISAMQDSESEIVELTVLTGDDLWFKSWRFSFHQLPIEENINSTVYERAWNTVIVSFDTQERESAITACKQENLEVYITRYGDETLINEWKDWCEYFAFGPSSTLEVTEFGIKINLNDIVKNEYYMLSPLSVSYAEGQFSLLIDPCNNNSTITQTGFGCVFPPSEQLIQVNWWMLLVAYEWSFDYDHYLNLEQCEETFECWRCLREDELIQMQYCPTGPSTRYYGKKLWDSIIAYVESDKELLDNITVEKTILVNTKEPDSKNWEEMTFHKILEDGSLSFETYASAAKNDNERWKLHHQWKTIKWRLAPSLTTDPTDRFLNEQRDGLR